MVSTRFRHIATHLGVRSFIDYPCVQVHLAKPINAVKPPSSLSASRFQDTRTLRFLINSQILAFCNKLQQFVNSLQPLSPSERLCNNLWTDCNRLQLRPQRRSFPHSPKPGVEHKVVWRVGCYWFV